MKLTKTQLKKLIKEEHKKILKEGAANFSVHNASLVYIIEFPEDADNHDYQEEIEILQDHLAQTNAYNFDPNYGVEDKSENRNYPSRVLGSYVYTKIFDFKIDGQESDAAGKYGVILTCIIRSGYYEHANLDWQLSYSAPTESDIDDIDGVKDEIESYLSNNNPQIANFIEKRVIPWMQKTAAAMVKFTEQEFAKLTQPYKHVATFSNGEAVYEKA